MSDQIKVLSRDEVEIAGARLTRAIINERFPQLDGHRHYSLAVEAAGWREILRRMDAYEEPANVINQAVPPFCENHNKRMLLGFYDRPNSPPGNGWYCPDCVEEIARHKEPAPKWEPGVVLQNPQQEERKVRLDYLDVTGKWTFTSMNTGAEYVQDFDFSRWKVHRLPHEFKLGDWAQVVSGLHEPFKVNTIVTKGNGDSYVYGREQQQWLASSLKHVPPPKEEKPAPKWEPGMVLIRYGGERCRLDHEQKDGSWDYLSFSDGKVCNGFFPQDCKVHRLPHEFKVGDWFEYESYGKPEVTVVLDVNGENLQGKDGIIIQARFCRHVPPPKEETPSDVRDKIAQALRDVQQSAAKECFDLINYIQNEQSTSEWQYPLACAKDAIKQRFGLKEEKPSLQVKSCEHCGKTIDGMDPRIHPHGLGVCAPRDEKPSQERQVMPNDDDRTLRPVSTPTSAVTGAHRAVETSENPFKGRHWDEVARDANRDDALAETLCIKDLRDELNRLAGRKQ